MSDITTNDAAPVVGQAAESVNAESQDKATNASDVATSQSATTGDNAISSTPEFDAKTSYESLQAELSKRDKSYMELRREFTRRTQHESELQKKIDNLMSIVSKAAEVPIDPEQFFKGLQTQPLETLQPLFSKHVDGIKTEYEKKFEEMTERVTKSEYRAEKMARILDSENYPDYKKLEPLMQKLAMDENTPIDFEREPGEVLDALYKLARTLSMEDAVKQAEKHGQQKAEAQLAKEAATSVVTGGKAVPTNPANMSEKQLRQYFISKGMVDGF